MHLYFQDENVMCMYAALLSFFLSVSPQSLDPMRNSVIWNPSVTWVCWKHITESWS